MKIYDETTRQPVESPDLSAGNVYDGVLVTGYTQAHAEILPGTVTEKRPAGLRRWAPAQEITEPCQWYHRYTEAELARMKHPSALDRMEAQLIYTAMMTDTLLEE